MPPSILRSGSGQPTVQKKTVAGNKVIIDQSKREQFNALSGLRSLVKKLRSEWTIEANTDEISDGTFLSCRMFIIPGPRAKFNSNEIDALRKFLTEGGAVFIMTEECDAGADTNINFFLEEYGIMANSDSVIRTIFYKYFDPKEALISNGILNRAIPVAAGRIATNDANAYSQSLSFVYPFGCTLNVNRLSSAVLSTGSACFPISRPVAAFHEEQDSTGALAVIGSVHVFHDSYIDKEDNSKIFKVFIDYLLGMFEPNRMDASEPEITDYYPIPDHIYMSEQVKVCLSEGDVDTPISAGTDFMRLFDSKLAAFDPGKWPKVIRAYDDLGLKHERLSLITPTFEVPLLKLAPAVYTPKFRELPPPELEMFDLDDLFSSREVRLAQLVHKCNDDDLEYFIREAGDAVDVNSSLPANDRTARRVLEKILYQLVEYKKNSLDEDDARLLQAAEDAALFDVPPAGDVADFSDLDDYDD